MRPRPPIGFWELQSVMRTYMENPPSWAPYINILALREKMMEMLDIELGLRPRDMPPEDPDEPMNEGIAQGIVGRG